MAEPEEGPEKMANTYRMTDKDIRLMIELRATNAAIFTGRRNSAMRGWRAIRKEMGLQGALSARQLKKKWDNMKDKYKVLKYPPIGMETVTQPSSWRWFHLMEQALSGRLAGSATVIQPSLVDEDEEHSAASPAPPSAEADFSEPSAVEMESLEGIALELSGGESPAAIVSGDGHEMEAQPAADKDLMKRTPVSPRNLVAEAADVDRKLVDLQREKRALEREQTEFDRELISLEKDRELLNKDLASLERDRAAVERDRAAVERDRAFLDRDRAFLDRDRAFLDRDRAFLERAREDLERDKALLRRERAALDGNQAEETSEKEVLLQTRLYQSLTVADLDPDQLETGQRLVSLFQKLVEKL